MKFDLVPKEKSAKPPIRFELVPKDAPAEAPRAPSAPFKFELIPVDKPKSGRFDEQAFQSWYSEQASKTGINPNPDDPQHFYDYRGAFSAGATPGLDGHWPSQFKKEGHPRMVLDGVNTKTGLPDDSPSELPAMASKAVKFAAKPFTPSKSLTEGFETFKKPFSVSTIDTPETRRMAGDVTLSTAKGVIGAGESAVGLADLVSGGYAGNVLEKAGYDPREAKALLDKYYSIPQKRAFKNVENAKGLIDTAVAALSNPSVIAHSVIESIPAMMGGAAVARKAIALGVPAITAAASGEGLASMGSFAEGARQQSKDKLLSMKQTGLAVASGVLTGALGIFGGKLAKYLGIADIETMLAGGLSNEVAARGLTKQMIYGAVQEGFLEELPQSVQEKVLSNEANGRPLDEGVDQAAVMGTLAGVVMGAGTQVADSIGQSIAKKSAEVVPNLTPPSPAYLKTVAQSFHPEVPYFVAGHGMMTGSDGLAGISSSLSKWFGVGDQAILSGMVESGTVYNQALAAGKTPEQADLEATQAFWGRLPVNLIANKLGIDPSMADALKQGDSQLSQQIIQSMSLHDPNLVVPPSPEGGIPPSPSGASLSGEQPPSATTPAASAPTPEPVTKPRVTPEQFEKHYEPSGAKGEDQATEFVRKNLDTFETAYDEAAKKELKSETANYISADLAKTVDVPGRPAFKSEDSTTRHKGAAAFAKSKYDNLLSDPETSDLPVMFSAGISGAGKTTSIKNMGPTDDYAAVYDTNLSNVDFSRRVIDQALRSSPERKVAVVYTERDPVKAFTEGVYARFLSHPEHRIVPIDVHVGYMKTRDTILKLAEHYGSDPRVSFRFIDNNGPKGQAREVGIEKIANLSYNENEVRRTLNEFIEQKYREGALTREQAQTFLGHDIRSDRGQDSGRHDQGTERPQEPPPAPEVKPRPSSETASKEGAPSLPVKFTLTPKAETPEIIRIPSESVVNAVESDEALNDILTDVTALKTATTSPHFSLKEVAKRMVGVRKKLIDVVDLYVKTDSKKSEALARITQAQTPGSLQKIANSLVETINKESAPVEEAPKAVIERKTGVNPIREMLNVREDQALKNQIMAEARGAKEGLKVGVQEGREVTREKMVERFRAGAQKVSETIEFIKNSLPVSERGKFIKAASEATTAKKHYSIFARVVERVDEIERAKTAQEVKEFSRPSDKIPVDYQRKLQELVEPVDFKSMTEATIQKLKGLREFLLKNGEPMGIDPKKIEAVDRLSKKGIKDMTQAELSELKSRLQAIQEQGRLKLSLKYKYNVREWRRNLDKLVASTSNIDPVSTGAEKLDKAKAETLRYYMETMHTMRVADMLDGFKGYKGENVRHLRELAQSEDNAVLEHRKKIASFLEQAKTIKTDWSESELEAMAYHIYLEMKSYDQVQALISSRNMKSEPVLTPDMRKMVDLMRKVVDINADKIAAVYEETTNQPFEKVKNYFPIKYEKEFNLISPATIEQNRYRTSQAFKGFTFGRKEGVKKIPRTDLFNIIDEAISEQEWYLNLQPKLEDISYLVKSEDYAKAAGEVAQNFWKNALDIIARRGWSSTAHSNFLIREGRINLQKAILGYKLSSILMQPMAIFDALAYVSATHGPRMSADVLSEFSKTWLNPKRANEFISKSPALQARAGGEEAISETLDAARHSSQFYRVYTEKGMKLLQRADIITAAGIEQGVYKALVRGGMEKEEAQKEADFIMNLVSGSNNVTYRPQILSRGEGARAWFTFQNFFLNRWGIMAHDLIQGGVVKGDYKKKLSALIGMAIFVAGSLAEKEARSWVYRMISGKKPRPESALATALLTIPTSVPFFGNLIEAAYAQSKGSRMSSLPPILKVAEDGLKGGFQTFTGKSKGARIKGMLKATEAAATLGLGIPGTSQTFDVVERLLSKPKGSGSSEPKEKF